MMITEIYKDKNFICFKTDDNNKVYKYDINTGNFLGLRGTPILTIPKREIYNCLEYRITYEHSPLLRTLREIVYYNTFPLGQSETAKTMLQIADKLEAVKCNNGEAVSLIHVEYYNEYPTIFIDYFRKNPEHGIYNFEEYIKKERWIKIIEPCKIDNIGIRDTIISILSSVFNTIDKDIEHFVPFTLKHYITKPMLDIYTERVNDYSYYYVPFNILLSQIYTISKELNISIKELPTYDIVTTHSILYRDYLIHKNKIINEKIKTNQEKRQLAYGNDNYIVVVPFTNKELAIEGQKTTQLCWRLWSIYR